MEYVFGTLHRDGVMYENLKTIGKEHSNLKGRVQLIKEHFDSTVTDEFFVIEHYNSDEDAEGNCYDWYLIDKHWRNVDKFIDVLNALLGEDETDEAEVTA